ncbi:hypothetical protein AOC05_07275 [Arthrobacter alpinus]|uniref:DUF222 domain-containing protein n=1 Tax=Arthrobacter alpinus TaxID=656366 RepID=A0A0M4QWB8_9MICC|nr:DUF222 domain-containing protein [Arthrobacter alpinus]ALE92186.1 hypothetical protein AOC05_07275 [Arthrobacter alpinus]
MGTVDRSGSKRGSTPSGQAFLDQDPGFGPEGIVGGDFSGHDSFGVAVDAVVDGDGAALARLIASDPFADDPQMRNVTWIGPSREISAEEWAAQFLPAAPVPGLGVGALLPVSLSGVGADAAVAVVRASVPDLPKAPRKDNPAGVVWTPAAGAEALEVLDPAGLADNEVLDFMHAANRLAAFAQAREAEAVAVFATRRPPLADEPVRERGGVSLWAAGELMAVYAIGRGAAEHRLDDAATLTALPATLALHRQGLLDGLRIRAIHRGLENVPEELFLVLEPLFLPGAARMNPAGLTRKIRRLAERFNPEPLAVRHERARIQRRVWFTPLPDGMAQLGAILPATPALALFQSLEAWARQAQQDGEPSTALTPTGRPSRSYDNYLADCFLDLIHQAFLHPATSCTDCSCNNPTPDHPAPDHPAPHPTTGLSGNGLSGNGLAGNGLPGGGSVPEPRFAPRIPAKVNVTIPFLTLLNTSEEPGHLDGYGPIPADQARELAAGASSWHRILTDPEKGTIVSIGRTAYKPPADMVRLVRLRDPVCTGIGCDTPARNCQIDHTIPFHQTRYTLNGTALPKGHTSTENLCPRSIYCHRLKDEPTTGWNVEPAENGATKTTTPTGREYLHNHPDNEQNAPF